MNKFETMIDTSTFFKENEDAVINTDKVKEAFIDKCFILMTKQGHPTSQMIGKIQHVFENDLHYFYFESKSYLYSDKAKRYHLGVYSYLLFDLHYTDSNIIDNDKSYSLNDVRDRFKGYINSLHKLVNQ